MSEKDVQDVDLLVIGGDKTGNSLAMDHTKVGWKVAMMERDKTGDTCINAACIPRKRSSARPAPTVSSTCWRRPACAALGR